MDENDYPNLLNRYLLENLVNLPERIALTFVLPFYAKKDDLPIEKILTNSKKLCRKMFLTQLILCIATNSDIQITLFLEPFFTIK